MENTWITVSVIAALVIGLMGGFYLDNPATITTEKEVIKYVDRNVTEFVEVDTSDALMGGALQDFLDALEEDEETWCKGDEYDIEEVQVRKVYNDYSITYDDEDTTIEFEVKLKYDDSDDKCYKTYDVTAFYEEDEDVEVDY